MLEAINSFNGATARRPWRYGQFRSLFFTSNLTASMGPRPEDRGIGYPALASVSGFLPASMGPRPEDRGIESRPLFCLSRAMASMGPRPEDRGIVSFSLDRDCFPISFNGATARRPRNSRGSMRHLPENLSASMGPRPEDRGIGPPFLDLAGKRLQHVSRAVALSEHGSGMIRRSLLS